MEPAIYARHGVDARFVGHPLADAMALDPDRAARAYAARPRRTAPVLALLPGSRIGEIQRSAGDFLDAAARVAGGRADVAGRAPMASAQARGVFEGVLASHAAADALRPALRITDGNARTAMVASDVVLLASGTATLEAMLAQRPMVVGYRIAPLTHAIVKGLGMLKVDNYALPNVLAGEQRGAGTDAARLHARGDWPRRCCAGSGDPGAVAALQPRFRAIHAGLRRDASAQAARAVAELLQAEAIDPMPLGSAAAAHERIAIDPDSCRRPTPGEMPRRRPAFEAPTIAGIDEAGRGPLAGPVVVAAVVFEPGRTPINGLADSKQLCAERREVLYARIVERALAWHVVFIEVDEIDRINIYHATMLGMRRALEGVLHVGRRRGAHRRQCFAARPALSGRGDHRRRCERSLDHGGIDPRQGLARPAHARTAPAMAAVRVRRAQGLFDTRAPGRVGAARTMPAAPTQFRAGACRARTCSRRIAARTTDSHNAESAAAFSVRTRQYTSGNPHWHLTDGDIHATGSHAPRIIARHDRMRIPPVALPIAPRCTDRHTGGIPWLTCSQTITGRTRLPWPPSHTSRAAANAPATGPCGGGSRTFDALVHEIHPDAPRVDADHVAQLSRWLLAMPEERRPRGAGRAPGTHRQVAAHGRRPRLGLRRFATARTSRRCSPTWTRMNLIPDRTPMLGKLDDVLLLELTWPALAAEVDEYEDFCRYRDSEHPDGQRAAAARDLDPRPAGRAGAGAHQQRVSDSHYARPGARTTPFRIGG